MKLVLVEWVDSSSRHCWTRLNERKGSELLRCRSVGWLVEETKEVLVLAPHMSGEGQGVHVMGTGDMAIPRVAVRRVMVLKSGPASKR
jgi:hypothetical protein